MNILILLTLLVGRAVCDRVIFSAVVTKHGTSVPLKLFKKGPQASEFPVQKGHLTSVGKQEMFYLGAAMRYLYQHLMETIMNPSNETFFRSTDNESAITSARAFMAGFFSNSSTTWEDELSWIRMKVHRQERKKDYIMGASDFCNAHNLKLASYKKSKFYIHTFVRYDLLLRCLSNKTGENVRTFDDLRNIYLVLRTQQNLGMVLPTWSQGIYPSPMNQGVAFSLSVPTITPELARLKVGPLLNNIVSYMDAASRAKDNETYIKLMVFVGHDDTIVNVLNGLGLYDRRVPEPGAAVVFELVVDDENNSFIRIGHKKFKATIDIHYMEIPNCASPCHIQDFMSVYRAILTRTWHHECQTMPAEYFVIGLILMIMFSSIIIYKKLNSNCLLNGK